MMATRTYLVDSDVFITAKNLYYSFAICPGFRKSMIHHHRQGRIFSIDRVRSELLAGHKTEDLVRWVTDEVPEGFFVPVDTDAVVRTYMDILWFGHILRPESHGRAGAGAAFRVRPAPFREEERAATGVPAGCGGGRPRNWGRFGPWPTRRQFVGVFPLRSCSA